MPHDVFGLEEGWRPVRQGLKGRTVEGIEARPVNTENRFQESGYGTPSTHSAFSLLDDETEDLCTTDDYECVMVEGILDSGSVAHVVDKAEAPGRKVEETAASRRRQLFTEVGGDKIVNESETNLQLLAENGHTGKSQHIRCRVQAAKGTRPILPQWQDLRQRHRCALQEGLFCDLRRQGKEVTRRPRANGTYRCKAKLRAPKQDEETAAVRRQGA